MKIKKVGPFRWMRRDDNDDEAWDLVQPEGLRFTYWCVKNYGGAPNDNSGFSGWRLVSGGPFSSAGGWTSREDAMRGVVPFLVKWYRDDLKKRSEEVERAKKAISKILTEAT